MAKEIERKFLVIDDSFQSLATQTIEISQAYISRVPGCTMRVRIAGERGYLTVKTAVQGISRNEWEYEIPLADAREMIAKCGHGRVLTKTRYIVPWHGHRWEVDTFAGALSPLVVAEIELSHPDEEFTLPPFIGAEVTGNPAYYNSNLVARIYGDGAD